MCISPITLPDGVQAACRECWQCLGRKIDDWVGRCIAESRYATHTHSITLTYGRDENDNSDHIRAAILTYSDVQKYFKKLRKAGYKFRYLVAGEYGGQKQRAHWHLVIFWHGDHPPVEFDKRFNEDHWEHGYSFFEKIKNGTMQNAKAVRYVCKYILKDQKDEQASAHFSMSKKPPIGHEYFQDYAQRYVDAGQAPQHLKYRFPEVIKNGKQKEFMMTGTTAQNFMKAFVTKWLEQRDGHIPSSELIEEYQDSLIEPNHMVELFRKGISLGKISAAYEKYENYHKKLQTQKYKDIVSFYSAQDAYAKRADGTYLRKAKEADSKTNSASKQRASKSGRTPTNERKRKKR